jgi:anti-sigma factor RsiW
MQSDSHQPFEEELAAYLLDALSEDEKRAFEAHLVTCEPCQARERWLRTSVEVLPSSVEQLEPPPALRERLLETVRSEAADSVVTAPEVAPAAPRRQATSRRRWTARLGRVALRPAAALATVLIVAAGVAGYAIRGGGGGETTTINAQGTPALPAARAAIVRTGDHGILRVENLPQRKGHVYEVWLARGRAKPIPSALFQVNGAGSGTAGIPGGLDDATVVMVTLEPAGGSPQPTTKPVLRATV